MKRAVLNITCLALAACGNDPARSVKIARHQPAPVTVAYIPPRGPDRNLLPEFCPPPGDSPGPGNFAAKGPCAFQIREPVSCTAMGDDFIVAVPRKAKNGGTLVAYLNVEHYHGPGAYDGAQLFVAVQSGTAMYRWSSDNLHATVGPGEAFVTLPRSELEQEPMRFDCSRLIGPESNYQYQCQAATTTNLEIDNAPEIVSGTLVCATPMK